MKRLVILVVALIGIGALFWFLTRRDAPAPTRSIPGSPAPVASRPLEVEQGGVVLAPDSIELLNAPSRTIQDDVHVLQAVFANWLTNFPATGNPIGTNAEITCALWGDNRLRLDLIPRDHPAINARGELCDRWSTPFRFHQLSGSQMQIISAGPDRDFATEDDVMAPEPSIGGADPR